MADTALAEPPRSPAQLVRNHWFIGLGLAVLGAPTLLSLGRQVWSTEAGAQGPIVLFTGAWLIWRKMPTLRKEAVLGSAWITGLVAAASLALYIFGRAYDFISLEVGGLYGMALACLYSYVGHRALLKMWFPLFYMAFIVPPPGWLIDGVTAPLKEFVSFAATNLLQLFGLPIVREGVTLFVAQYQLLVEDACSGMNSLTGLIAISLFYIYLLRDASWRYSLFLICLVIPIAVVANIIRIIILVLLTVFAGDGVAQGFLHVSAGLFLFAVALALVFSIDHMISLLRARSRSAA